MVHKVDKEERLMPSIPTAITQTELFGMRILQILEIGVQPTIYMRMELLMPSQDIKVWITT